MYTKITCIWMLLWVHGTITSLMAQGDILSRTIIHNDSVRSYLLYVPHAYTDTAEVPLVINYHGFQKTAEDQMSLSGMNSFADTANFLIVYPQGLSVYNPISSDFGSGWNHDGYFSNNDGVAFTLRLIDILHQEFAIDLQRVHATGWSMGANMAFEVSCHLSDRIASVAGVASQKTNFQLLTCELVKPQSALLIQGTSDPIVPFYGDDVLFPPAGSILASRVERNSCHNQFLTHELADVDASDSCTVTRIEYTGCYHDTEIVFFRINGGGHTWPGGGNLLPYFGLKNTDIDASKEIWNFFKRNTKTTPVTSLKPSLKAKNNPFILYPNPATDRLHIKMELSKASSVTFELYQNTGELLGTLADYSMSSGLHEITWDLEPFALTTGVYYLSVKTEKYIWGETVFIVATN